MNIYETIISEIKHEADKTNKMLERLASEHFDWKPHEKSMSLIKLATHVADLPSWVAYTLKLNELDLAGDFKPFKPESVSDLIEHHNKCVADAVEALENAPADELSKMWVLKHGAHQIFELPKGVVLRDMCLNHMIHHRGQLSVYLRLLDIPVPGIYGPSADEK